MFKVILVEPKIPQNTGNIIRLCANSGSALSLVEPLGFRLDEKSLKRSKLDYGDIEKIKIYPNWQKLEQSITSHKSRFVLLTTKAKKPYSEFKFQPNDCLIFGSETKGLDEALLQKYPAQCLTIPMVDNSRSLNLANAVAIVLFEAWRQQNFK